MGAGLWLSEYTVQSDRNSRAFSFHVSREQQAQWLQRAYEIADDNDFVYTMGWFNLLDEPTSVEFGLTTGAGGIGPGKTDGEPTRRPVPYGS